MDELSKNVEEEIMDKKAEKKRKKKARTVKKEETPVKNVVESTQSNMPIIDVYEGVLITKDHRYVKILEVKPITFNMLAPKEQDEIMMRFAEMLKRIPGKIQFTAMTLPADLSTQINILEREIKEETNNSCRIIDYEYRRKLFESQYEGVSRRFFISFEHTVRAIDKVNIDDIVSIMNNKAATIENTLNSIGNKVVHIEKNLNYQTLEILYTFLNRGKIMSEPFDEHLQNTFNRYYDFYGHTNYFIPPADIIAPDTMSFLNDKYVVVNGRYYSFLYIAANGYNDRVTVGWLTPYISSYEGVDVNIYLQKEDREKMINKIRRQLTYSRVNASEVSDNSNTFDSAMSTANAAEYLKAGIQAGNDFYYMHIMLTVSGETPEEVDAKIDSIVKFSRGVDITMYETKYDEEAAFMSSLPLCYLDPVIANKSRRNVLTTGAASTYPFTTFEMNDPDGVYLGDELMGGSLAIVDIFNTERFSNANMFICGQTGAGKTYTLLLLAVRMRIKHIPVFILAPEKEHEFRRVCEAVGGQFIELGAGSPTRINIMEIFKRDEAAEKAQRLIDGAHESSSYLTAKVQTLKRFFSLLITDITVEEMQLLDEALMRVYKAKGITIDNNSIFDPNDPTHQTYKQMPIISDLREELLKNERTVRMANIISILCTGSGESFNGQTNVDLDNEFTVIGLEHLNGDMMPLGIFMAMEYVWSKIKEDRTRKKALFIDEWWKLAYNPISAEYSLEIAKVIRAYGGSMVLATQQMSDVLAIDDGKYGKGVLNNCKTKILMSMEPDDAKAVKNILKLTPSEANSLTKFGRGEGLLIASGNDMAIKFRASEMEHRLLTTDRAELAQLAKEEEAAEEKRRLEREAKVVRDNNYFDI